MGGIYDHSFPDPTLTELCSEDSVLLEKLIVSQLVARNYLPLVGRESSSSYSQESTIGLCSEPEESRPNANKALLKDNYLFLTAVVVLQICCLLEVMLS